MADIKLQKVMRYNLKDFISTDGTTLHFCGVGFTQFDENAGAQVESVGYINNKNASPYIKSYERTFEYAADVHVGTDAAAITMLIDTSRNSKVGSAAELVYFRTDPAIDMTTGGDLLKNIPCRKMKVTNENAGSTGEALSAAQTSGTLHQVGDAEEGFLTIDPTTLVATWSVTETASEGGGTPVAPINETSTKTATTKL